MNITARKLFWGTLGATVGLIPATVANVFPWWATLIPIGIVATVFLLSLIIAVAIIIVMAVTGDWLDSPE